MTSTPQRYNYYPLQNIFKQKADIIIFLFFFGFYLLLQESDKCFECNSQRPYHPEHHRNSHRIENVIYLMNPEETKKTWWQSVNGRWSRVGQGADATRSGRSVGRVTDWSVG